MSPKDKTFFNRDLISEGFKQLVLVNRLGGTSFEDD